MQIESLENILLSTINPFLKSVVKEFDVECEQDGSMHALWRKVVKHFT
jgi:hypothetical protein